ncbi:MAG TPA: protease modulator HflC [Pseudomonadales bacterium]|nr:protease modulator HflC [Pseudomonadales bacterium]
MMRSNVIFIVVVAVVLLLAFDGVYEVKQTERAVLLRFGAVQRADVQPGLHFKWPIAESVKTTDARVLTLDSQAERYYTLEKKPLIVDSFVKWRVADVATFYTATSFDERQAERLLSERANEGLRNQVSRRTMHEVISGARDELMKELTESLDHYMRRDVGVEVIDVRVKKIDLPPEVSTAVYDRMNSERQILARQFRATGREQSLEIRGDADRQVVVIAADAYRKAEETRGEGDAKSAAIYAAAFSQDPDFYRFYRSINAYVNVFEDKSDLLVIDPESEFFRYLKQSEK